MKWKPDVIVERKKSYILHQNSEQKVVAAEDCYIIDAIERGLTDDKQLISVVMKQEAVDDVVAGFRLGQFILDYADYISNDVGYMMIEP